MLGLGIGLWLGHNPAATGGGGAPVVLSSINADGWTAEYSGTIPTLDPDGAPSLLTVTQGGYTAVAGTPGSVTYSASAYADETIRPVMQKRSPAPSDATLSSTTVTLSDYLYSTSSLSGVTNNSTVVSPKPVAQWTTAGRQLIDSASPTVTGGVIAAHRDGIAAVQVILTDGVTTLTQTITSPTFHTRTGDWTGVIEYRYSIDATSLAAGSIRRRFKVYPNYGTENTSVLDSNDGTDEGRGACTKLDWKGPKYYIYVDAAGNDTTGVASTTAATAAATPCLTFAGAIARARVQMPGNRVPGLEVRLNAGTWSNTGVTFNTYHDADTAEVILTRNPSVARASVIWSWTAQQNLYLKYLRVQDLTLARNGSTGFAGNFTGQLTLRDIDFTTINTPGTQLQGTPTYFEGGIVLPASALGAFLLSLNVYMVRGVTAGTLAGVTQVMNFHIAGSKILGCEGQNNSQSENNGLQVESYLAQPVAGANPITGAALTAAATATGYLFRNVVTEYNNANSAGANTPTGGLRISNDGTGSSSSHIIVQNCTMTGAGNAGRSNWAYDESATTVRRTHELWRVEGCVMPQFNLKQDRFVHYNQANADAVNRIGGWSVLSGVGFRDNYVCSRDADSSYAGASRTGLTGAFSPEYAGTGYTKATTSTRLDPLFTSPACCTLSGSTYSSGAGNGTYTLQSGSPLKTLQTVRRSTPAFDAAGNSRGAVGGTTSIGAYI